MKRTIQLSALIVSLLWSAKAHAQYNGFQRDRKPFAFQSVHAGAGFLKVLDQNDEQHMDILLPALSLSYMGQGGMGFNYEYLYAAKLADRPENYVTGDGVVATDDIDRERIHLHSVTYKYAFKLAPRINFNLESGLTFIRALVYEYEPREVVTYKESHIFWLLFIPFTYEDQHTSSNYYKSKKQVNTVGLPLRASLTVKLSRFVAFETILRSDINRIKTNNAAEFKLMVGFWKR